MASRSAKKASSSVMVPASKKGEPATTFPGKAVMQESKERSKGFKRGGRTKGGSESMASETCGPTTGGRLDKAPRKASGGAVTMRGRSPLSAANSLSAASTKTTH